MATAADGDLALRIAFLTYRGKPHVGGQGVYTRHLTKALVDLGHDVEVLGGQPYPILDDRVPLVELPSLDIYNDHFPMRIPGLWELKTWGDVVEVGVVLGGTFPEPLAFSIRAWQHLRPRINDFDLVQDNQSLGYGLLGIERAGLPVLATIHHPITVDRRLEMEHAETPWKRFSKGRWYAFTKMQTRVANRMPAAHHRVEELPRRHPRRPRGAARPAPRRARRRRPGALPAAARRATRSRGGSSPPPAPTSP